MPPGDTRRVVSWNVNGLRACAKKGFGRWLARSRAEIVSESISPGSMADFGTQAAAPLVNRW